MPQYTKASVDEAWHKVEESWINLTEMWHQVEESWSRKPEMWTEFKNGLPELPAIPCALLVQLSLVMTILVILNWGRLEQRILLDEGDCSMREVIFKLGLWIASGLLGYLQVLFFD